MPETASASFRKARSSVGVLLPYQKAWVEDKSDVKMVEKSRRVGVSWAEAADDTLYASERGRGEKRNVWYIGYTKDMALEFINDAANWAKAYNLAASAIESYEEKDIVESGSVVEEKKIQAFRITLSSGWRITALSSRPSNLRGKQGVIVIDEAAFHSDLAGLKKAAIAHLMWGGKVRIISTHNGVDNPFNEMISDVRSGKLPYSLHRVTLDDALAQGLYRRICQVLRREWSPDAEAKWRAGLIEGYGEDAQEELFCVPAQSGGAWLSRALIESRMEPGPVIRWDSPAGFELWSDELRQAEMQVWLQAQVAPLLSGLSPLFQSGLGEDFGRSGDLTVFAPWQRGQDLVRRFPFLVELRNCPFRQQEQALFFIADRLPRLSGMALDSRGNGQYLAEVAAQRYGSCVQQVMLSEMWYRENTAPFKAAFEDGTILLPRDADVATDLRAFQVIKGIPRLPDIRTQDAKGKKRHGDAAIALLLGYVASLGDAMSIEFDSSGPRESFDAEEGGYDFGGSSQIGGSYGI